MKDLCEIYSKQIKLFTKDGELARPLKFQDEEYFDTMFCHIPFFDQVQHILWMLSEIPRMPENYQYLTLGFVQGWMVKENYVTLNWVIHSIDKGVNA